MKILEDSLDDKKRYKEFLTTHDRCNFQQSLEWGEVKDQWIKKVVVSEDENGNILGSICVWIRKLPVFGNMMYVSRGPVCDIHNKNVLTDLKNGLDVLAKEYKAFVLRMEPDVEKTDTLFRSIMEDLGFKINDTSKDFKDEVQPRFVFKLDLKGKSKDQIFSEFQSKTRYNVRLAMKKGVVIKEGKKEDLDEFYNIMKETGSRDGFRIRPLEYFRKMYDSLAPEHMKLLMAYFDNKPIAGIIPIMYGNKVWYLYGASSNSNRNLMPNYLLQWTMIQEAIDRGADVYDFRGVVGIIDKSHPQYGLYRFKKGFNAKLVEFIGEVYIPYKPIKYSFYKFSEKTLRTIRSFKNRKPKVKSKDKKTNDKSTKETEKHKSNE